MATTTDSQPAAHEAKDVPKNDLANVSVSTAVDTLVDAHPPSTSQGKLESAYPNTNSENASEKVPNDDEPKAYSDVADGAPSRRSFAFWAIIFSLCVTGLLSALENTVVVTSLPTIVEELGLGRDYVWVTNVFFLTSYVLPSSALGQSTPQIAVRGKRPR